MYEDVPSLSAAMVAFGRALYTAAPPEFHVPPDPVAAGLLPWPLNHVAHAILRHPRTFGPTRRALDAAAFGLLGAVALRTAAIDAALRAALAEGVTQVVLLGAGLDARAHRIDALADARVFEVDYPASQRYKRARVGARAPRAREVRYVPVDFERDALGACLARAGHDATRATFWIWEGVTMYLLPAATEATLAVVAARSAPDSALAVTYISRDAMPGGPRVGAAAALLARVGGEPLRGLLTREAMAAHLARAGFAVRSDETATDWAARYWPAYAAARVRPGERLAVAVRA